MVITPVETVFATAEPDTEPIKPEPTTATRPAPPVNLPARHCANRTIKSPAPDLRRNDPKIMNMKTKVDDI